MTHGEKISSQLLSRGVRVALPFEPALQLPAVHPNAASDPNRRDLPVRHQLVRPTAHYPQIGAGIEEGDKLLVEENEDPPDGAAVVALLRDEKVTVKRLHRDAEKVRIRPQNKEHGEIVLPAEEVAVQGEVMLVIHPPRR